MLFLKLFSLGFALWAPAITALDFVNVRTDGCPVGWINSSEGCYFFLHTKALRWEDAQVACEEMGGYLAEPKTVDEIDLLYSLALEHTILGVDIWWIGLTDQNHEGRWVWAHSVTDMSFFDWASGSPKTGNNMEDCAAMDVQHSFRWTDKNCTELASPICQHSRGRHQIQLRGGFENCTGTCGNVFTTNSEGVFGPVCDDGWVARNARVVCHQLGYSTGTPTARSYYGHVQSAFAMTDVHCTGDEDYIQQCSYTAPGAAASHHVCSEAEGAGVRCS